jgi:hypothetical protein
MSVVEWKYCVRCSARFLLLVISLIKTANALYSEEERMRFLARKPFLSISILNRANTISITNKRIPEKLLLHNN